MKKPLLLAVLYGLPVQCGTWLLAPLGGIAALAVPVALIRRST